MNFRAILANIAETSGIIKAPPAGTIDAIGTIVNVGEAHRRANGLNDQEFHDWQAQRYDGDGLTNYVVQFNTAGVDTPDGTIFEAEIPLGCVEQAAKNPDALVVCNIQREPGTTRYVVNSFTPFTG